MPSIEELIQQVTGKSFQDMDDEELIDLVNSTRNCYQVLGAAAQMRKARRVKNKDFGPGVDAELDLLEDIFGDVSDTADEVNLGTITLSLGTDDEEL
jgi:Mg2+/Co2+ transporter CorC